MNPSFVSTLCAVRYETCQHSYPCHEWCHELLLPMSNLVAFYAILNEKYKKTLRDIRTLTYQIYSIEEKIFEQSNFTNDYVI